MDIIGCSEVVRFEHKPFLLKVKKYILKSCSTRDIHLFTKKKKVTETMDFPLYWAFVRATDNYGGEFFEGDGAYAAKQSCKLAVKLPASIPLFVREPRQLYIEAYTNDNKISHYQFANYSR
jgi:hypothetical protein